MGKRTGLRGKLFNYIETNKEVEISKLRLIEEIDNPSTLTNALSDLVRKKLIIKYKVGAETYYKLANTNEKELKEYDYKQIGLGVIEHILELREKIEKLTEENEKLKEEIEDNKILLEDYDKLQSDNRVLHEKVTKLTTENYAFNGKKIKF